MARRKSKMPSRKKSAGNFRSTAAGAGMTAAGVKKYRAANPGSKLSTAVTEKNPGPKRAKRRANFCSRSRSWKGERGKAARRRWRC